MTEKPNDKYIKLVKDIINHEYIAPVKTLKKYSKNWICYCGEDGLNLELKYLTNYLLSKNITEITVITFSVLKTIKIKKIDNLTYDKLCKYYYSNESNWSYSNTIFTTKDFDFICFEDDEPTCFAICGPKDLVEASFLGRTYEKMKSKFINNSKKHSMTKVGYDYRIKFFKYYEQLSKHI